MTVATPTAIDTTTMNATAALLAATTKDTTATTTTTTNPIGSESPRSTRPSSSPPLSASSSSYSSFSDAPENDTGFYFAFNNPQFADVRLLLNTAGAVENDTNNNDNNDKKKRTANEMSSFEDGSSARYLPRARDSSSSMCCACSSMTNRNCVWASKLLLSKHSDAFRSTFTSGMVESTSNEVSIELKPSEQAAFVDMIRFMYEGRFEATSKQDVLKILYQADKYAAPAVMRQCISILMKDITIEECCEYLDLPFANSIEPAIQDFMKQLCDFLVSEFKDFESVWFTDKWRSLSPKAVEKVLQSDNICVRSENVIFQSLMLYLKHRLDFLNATEPKTADSNNNNEAAAAPCKLSPAAAQRQRQLLIIEEREFFFKHLLPLVRFPMMDINFLNDVVKHNEIIVRIDEFRNKVNDAICYHAFPKARREDIQKVAIEKQDKMYIPRAENRNPLQFHWDINLADLKNSKSSNAPYLRSPNFWLNGYCCFLELVVKDRDPQTSTLKGKRLGLYFYVDRRITRIKSEKFYLKIRNLVQFRNKIKHQQASLAATASTTPSVATTTATTATTTTTATTAPIPTATTLLPPPPPPAVVVPPPTMPLAVPLPRTAAAAAAGAHPARITAAAAAAAAAALAGARAQQQQQLQQRIAPNHDVCFRSEVVYSNDSGHGVGDIFWAEANTPDWEFHDVSELLNWEHKWIDDNCVMHMICESSVVQESL